MNRYFFPFVETMVGIGYFLLAAQLVSAQDWNSTPTVDWGINAVGSEFANGGQMHLDLIACGPCSGGSNAGDCNNVAACATSFRNPSCRSSGLFIAAELAYVDIIQSSRNNVGTRLVEAVAPAAIAAAETSPGMQPTARLLLGWQNCDGLGVQVRFWDFDNGDLVTLPQAAGTDPNILSQFWDVTVFDLDAVQKSVRNPVLDSTVNLGFRFVNFEEGASLRLNNNPATNSVAARYLGYGLTGGGNLRRKVRQYLSATGNLRGSFLLGNQTITPTGVPDTGVGTGFDARFIVESQLGINYERPVFGGGFLFLSCGYEAQYWDGFTPAIGNQSDASSTLLHGLAVSVGFQR